MSNPKNDLDIKSRIMGFEKRIDDMHLEFYKYYQGDEQKIPYWEGLELELLNFSRRKIFDVVLSNNLDRVLYKFQNRKKIWLKWIEESHHIKKD